MVVAVEVWEMAGYSLKMEATRFTGVMNVVCKPMKRVKGDWEVWLEKQESRLPSSETDKIAKLIGREGQL